MSNLALLVVFTVVAPMLNLWIRRPVADGSQAGMLEAGSTR